MAKENKTMYAIVGLLVKQAMSSYDIKKQIDLSLSHFWNENYGHLYPVLARLEQDGLVTRTIAKGNKRPDRHLYQITPIGEAAVRAWLPRPTDPVKFRSELLLKILLGSLADHQTLVAMVQQEQAWHEAQLVVYDGLEKHIRANNQQAEDRDFPLLALENGRLYAQGQLVWCQKALAVLKARADGGNHD